VSALAHSHDVFVVNSFSKYYGMTGWRLGWLVAPEAYRAAIDRLAQNVFLAPNTPAQHAALAAFDPAVETELQRRRQVFAARRDYLLPALRELGFRIPVTPQGAFYLYADSSALTDDSETFARELLEHSGVAATPGLDFGTYRSRQHLRFSYANELENLREGVRRIAAHLRR
jgi:aspartate/methionine/tyrosine aminotransferase